MSRQYTDDECRHMFQSHVWDLIDYWEKEERAGTVREKLSGLAFSILAALDGDSVAIPGFVVAPAPSKEDEPYCRKNGIRWWPAAPMDVEHDLAGGLHERFGAVENNRVLSDFTEQLIKLRPSSEK